MPNTLNLGAWLAKNDGRVSEPALVIVGGGIAGGALAIVMARAGTSVLVLERQSDIGITFAARSSGRGVSEQPGCSGSSRNSSMPGRLSSAGWTRMTRGRTA